MLDREHQDRVANECCNAADEFRRAGQSLRCAADDAGVAAIALSRPSVQYGPKLYPDGDKWCALYGADLVEGVCGFGDTPEAAMADFDQNWREQRTPAARI